MSDQKKHIVMLGCFDTKGEEYRFLYDGGLMGGNLSFLCANLTIFYS